MRTYRGWALALLAPVLLAGAGPAAARPTGLVARPTGLVARPTAAPARPTMDAPAGVVAAVPAGVTFRWPLDGVPRPVRRFDPPPLPWSPGHRGVDLAGVPGALVRAAGPGVVFFAGLVAGRPVVSVSHPGGLRTTYEPVQPAVRAGDQVGAGDPLGTLRSGHPGCPAEACLHWGLRRGEDYLDPLALLGLGRVRLLPVVARRARWLNAGRRAGPAGAWRAGRTLRPGCRPAR
jgi:murein DD-endopeptidase MepM/ murein hydrolase activator NlpD